mgnify:CR=1 FL=1
MTHDAHVVVVHRVALAHTIKHAQHSQDQHNMFTADADC